MGELDWAQMWAVGHQLKNPGLDHLKGHFIERNQWIKEQQVEKKWIVRSLSTEPHFKLRTWTIYLKCHRSAYSRVFRLNDSNQIDCTFSWCFAVSVWPPDKNPNIFPASPSCVFVEIDSDGLWDPRTLGNGVSWRHREVCSRPFLWALGWPGARCTSSGVTATPLHKQFTCAGQPRGTWERTRERGFYRIFRCCS